jgi:outer membrane protein OmpA-like peptidoglycan-associated protein
MRAHFRLRPQHVRNVLSLTVAASLLPAGTAFAQSASSVKVTKEKVEVVSSLNALGEVVMTAPRGTVFEVLDTEGDRYSYRKSNWYWVLLPRDGRGTQRSGWISGHDVEQVELADTARVTPASQTVFVEAPRVEPAPAATAPAAPQPRASRVEYETPKTTAPSTPAAPAAQPELCDDIVLNFKFDKSDLSDDAKTRLNQAVSLLKSGVQEASFALEGYADSTGTEPYNEKLGRARAENVKRYLAEQHNIPLHKISVVSFGETHPAASNATKAGRAENRRVVVRVRS